MDLKEYGRLLIAVLFNHEDKVVRGDPHELVALQSTGKVAADIARTIAGLGFETAVIPARGSIDALRKLLQPYSTETTYIFNNCDGFEGDNMRAVEVLELIESMGFRHSGAEAGTTAACIMKDRTKALLASGGLPTPAFQVFDTPSDTIKCTFPAIVKPLHEDGSMGIDRGSVVSGPAELRGRLEYVIKTYSQPAIVEEFIPGKELAVALLGNDDIEVLPIKEEDYAMVADPLEHYLTFESKWDPDSFYFKNIVAKVPAVLEPEEERTVIATALACFKIMKLRDFGRIDIRLSSGVPYIIDVNEIPDLAVDAGYFRSARAAGYSYGAMIGRILTEGLKREGFMA